MKRLLVMFVVMGAVLVAGASADPITVELLVNGDFETGDLTAWTQTAPGAPLEWGVVTGPVGGFGISSPDGSQFATPWAMGPNPASTTLEQIADLTPYLPYLINNQLTLHVDAIYSNDAISFYLDFLDSSMASIIGPMSTPTFVDGPFPWTAEVNATLAMPVGTQYIAFGAIGMMNASTYTDAGFDNASLTVGLVPEPATIALFAVGLAGLGAYRRRRRAS